MPDPRPQREALATALETAVDQVVPYEELPMNARGTKYWHKVNQRSETRTQLLAIANELRGDIFCADSIFDITMEDNQ